MQSQAWRWNADMALPFAGATPSVKVPQRSPLSTKVYRTSDHHHGGEGGGDARWSGINSPAPPNSTNCPVEYLWQKAARDPNSATFLKSPLPQMKYSYRKWLLDHFDHNDQLMKLSVRKKAEENIAVPANVYDPLTYSLSAVQPQIEEVKPSTPKKKKLSLKGSSSSKGKSKERRRSAEKIESAIRYLQYAPAPVRGCLKSPNTSKIQRAPRVRFQLEKARGTEPQRVHRMSQTDTNLSSPKQGQGKKEIRRRSGGKPVRVHPKPAHSIRSSSHGPGMLSSISQISQQRIVRRSERPQEGSVPERKLTSKGSYLSKESSIGTDTSKSTSSVKRKKGKRKKICESRTESEADLPPVPSNTCPLKLKPSDSSRTESGSRQNLKEKRHRKETGLMAEEENRVHPNKASEHKLQETLERNVEGERPGNFHHEMPDQNIPKQSKRVDEVEKSSPKHSKNILTIRRTSVMDATRPFPHEGWRQKSRSKKRDDSSSKSDTESSGMSKKRENRKRRVRGKRESVRKQQENRGTIYNLNRMFYEDGHYDRRALHPLFDVATKQYRPPNHTALRAEERRFSKKVNIIHQLQEQRQKKKKGVPKRCFVAPVGATTFIPWK